MLRKILWGGSFVVVSAAVVVAGVLGAVHLQKVGSSALPCTKTDAQHVATIKNNRIEPTVITGKRCDTLKIVNLDAITREIGFGSHDHHFAYDGVAQQFIGSNQSLTVTLVQTGEFHFHDHFHREVAASFFVHP